MATPLETLTALSVSKLFDNTLSDFRRTVAEADPTYKASQQENFRKAAKDAETHLVVLTAIREAVAPYEFSKTNHGKFFDNGHGAWHTHSANFAVGGTMTGVGALDYFTLAQRCTPFMDICRERLAIACDIKRALDDWSFSKTYANATLTATDHIRYKWHDGLRGLFAEAYDGVPARLMGARNRLDHQANAFFSPMRRSDIAESVDKLASMAKESEQGNVHAIWTMSDIQRNYNPPSSEAYRLLRGLAFLELQGVKEIPFDGSITRSIESAGRQHADDSHDRVPPRMEDEVDREGNRYGAAINDKLQQLGIENPYKITWRGTSAELSAGERDALRISTLDTCRRVARGECIPA